MLMVQVIMQILRFHYGLDMVIFLCEFTVKADDMEEALEKVVAYLDKTHDSALFADRDLKSLDDEEIEDMEDDGQIMDVDATEFGAYSTHYIWTENLKFEEI